MYKSFFGTIGVMLRHGNKYSTVKSGQNDCCDDDSPGWNMIRKVASLRKKIRKLGLELRQVVQDIEVVMLIFNYFIHGVETRPLHSPPTLSL